MDSLSKNVAPARTTQVQTTNPTGGAASDRTGWMDGLKGMGDKVAGAFTSASDTTPKVGLKDRMLKLVDSNHLSPQEKEASTARIRQAADKLRYAKPGQTSGQAAGMSLEDAKKLQAYAETTGDKELIREAGFVRQMLTDMRPSSDAGPGSNESGQQRTLPTQYFLPGGSQARCNAAQGPILAAQGLKGDNFVRALNERCGEGISKD